MRAAPECSSVSPIKPHRASSPRAVRTTTETGVPRNRLASSVATPTIATIIPNRVRLTFSSSALRRDSQKAASNSAFANSASNPSGVYDRLPPLLVLGVAFARNQACVNTRPRVNRPPFKLTVGTSTLTQPNPRGCVQVSYSRFGFDPNQLHRHALQMLDGRRNTFRQC